MAKKWIPELKKGALHKELGIPEDQKIPISLINKKIAELKEKAKGDKKLSAKELQLLRRLNFAKTARKFHHESENLSSMVKYKILKEFIQLTNN